MAKFWLSFADGDLPKGTQFLGGVFVEAESAEHAVKRAAEIGCNPGGDILITKSPDGIRMAGEWMDRLLDRAEAGRVGELLVKINGPGPASPETSFICKACNAARVFAPCCHA